MKFGDRVEITEPALRMRSDGRKHRRTGVIVRQRQAIDHPGTVMVLRDGMKQTGKTAAGILEAGQLSRTFSVKKPRREIANKSRIVRRTAAACRQADNSYADQEIACAPWVALPPSGRNASLLIRLPTLPCLGAGTIRKCLQGMLRPCMAAISASNSRR
jgi:hypothetical protein